MFEPLKLRELKNIALEWAAMRGASFSERFHTASDFWSQSTFSEAEGQK
jgi:hypothetical protein